MIESEKAGARLLIDPSTTISFTDEACKSRKPSSSKEDWILLNANLIESIGKKAWLNNLLDVLYISHDEYDGHDIVNPALTITISQKFLDRSSKPIKRDDWINANTKLIDEMSETGWLELLLDLLE